jgi:LPS sulfotransferase NodH
VTRGTDSIIQVFSKEFLSEPRAFSSDSCAPMFIVGMPRSGTTLLASILSNHPAIATAGELPTIIQFTSQIGEWAGAGVTYPQAARHLSSPAAERLIGRYLERLRRDIAADVPYVIDKHPINFRHLGLIALLFPHATVIHCRRDPLDTCLSNYFQRFPPAYDFAFDLRNIGHYFRQYSRLMDHWRAALAKPMLEVSYEEMIANTEKVARSILDVLGLPWDERCLAPHTNPYAIETASKWQVRQPIYRHAVERWRHYEKHLTPLKGTLQLP